MLSRAKKAPLATNLQSKPLQTSL